MSDPRLSAEQRRRNRRLAWWLALFAVLMLISAIPFWSRLLDVKVVP